MTVSLSLMIAGMVLTVLAANHGLGAALASGGDLGGGFLSPLPAMVLLLAALVLIAGGSNLPFPPAIKRGLWHPGRSSGDLPLPARDLCRRLRRGHSFLAKDMAADVQARLVRQGLRSERLLGAPAGSSEALWLRCLQLMIALEDFALADPAFAYGQRTTLAQLDAEIRRQALVASLLFACARPPAAMDRQFRRDAQALLNDLAETAACGLIAGYGTAWARERELAAWGFVDPADGVPTGPLSVGAPN